MSEKGYTALALGALTSSSAGFWGGPNLAAKFSLGVTWTMDPVAVLAVLASVPRTCFPALCTRGGVHRHKTCADDVA